MILLAVPSLIARDSATKPLQSVLNRSNYNLVYPATSDVFAGGILVSDGKHSSFYGLPPGVPAPNTIPVNATWGKEDISSSFSLQALLSGLGKIVNAGAKFDKSNKLTLAQISASGSEITNPALSALTDNQIVMAQVGQWINQHFRVYVVHAALKTSSISVTSSGSWDVSAAFGTALPQCPPATSGNGTTPATSSTPATAQSQAPSKGAPTASLQACSNSNSSLSLTTDTPLVFAASLNPIVLINGKLQVGPILTLVTSGAVRGDGSRPPSSITWRKQDWPAAK
jgi:hypothetical protein